MFGPGRRGGRRAGRRAARRTVRRQDRRRAMFDDAMAPEAPAPAASAPPPAQESAVGGPAEPDYVAEIERLGQLKQKGLITDEEFENKKKQLLGL